MLELKTEDIVISTIIENYRSGLWSIPKPLSDYKWAKRKNRAAMFIADLYLGWPLSGIMLCELPMSHRCDEFEAEKRDAWMLDGHEQILTLCKIMNGDLKILFNPRVTDMKKGSEGQFRAEGVITKKTTGWIDVRRVLGSHEDFCTVLDEEESKEYRIRLIRLREVLNRTISVHKLIGQNYETILRAFIEWKMMANAEKRAFRFQ